MTDVQSATDAFASLGVADGGFPQYQPPDGSPQLPQGWLPLFDQQYGRWYYVDTSSGQTQWEAPGFDSTNSGRDVAGDYTTTDVDGTEQKDVNEDDDSSDFEVVSELEEGYEVVSESEDGSEEQAEERDVDDEESSEGEEEAAEEGEYVEEVEEEDGEEGDVEAEEEEEEEEEEEDEQSEQYEEHHNHEEHQQSEEQQEYDEE